MPLNKKQKVETPLVFNLSTLFTTLRVEFLLLFTLTSTCNIIDVK